MSKTKIEWAEETWNQKKAGRLLNGKTYDQMPGKVKLDKHKGNKNE